MVSESFLSHFFIVTINDWQSGLWNQRHKWIPGDTNNP